ncbi:DUF6088 family protein [Autumnicola psychrophila]|uniref:DUF6088 family protein n=1 Tax=Autumnicola psychrophila TaxID=3075592 RepID=A0ABU3DVE0_9FLAO|nr:DUF6088 family protein [Zunongwangia sp. F225]MDT0687675.1 DUF6088 family protein [Zunongwangia sp. F225]
MKVTKKIELKVNRMKEGTTFKYQQLGVNQDEYIAAAKAVERLVKKGVIKRTSTGVFYKPKQSVFGELKPKEEELLKPYLFRDGKRIAYITGSTLYNRMGLTTQVPKTIKVASKVKRVVTKIAKTQVKPVKSYVEVSNGNYYLLEILDALKDFKTISDMDKKSAIGLLTNKISNLVEDDLLKLVRYALKYPPRATALLGAILEASSKNQVEVLKNSLNPLTSYNMGIKEDILPTAPKWNIN